MKKIITTLLAGIMAVSIPLSAFAATTIATDGTNNIEASQVVKQENKTINFEGSAGTTTVYTIPVGSMLTMKGSGSLVYVELESSGTDSYTATDNGGLTDATFTIPQELEGKMIAVSSSYNTKLFVFCQISGKTSAPASKNVTVASSTYKSDTGSSLSVQKGKTYQFKITSLNGKKPVFVCGNSSIFKVSYTGRKGSNYYFMVRAVGKAGQSAGIYINGSKAPSTVAVIR
jgi:hypothetical protein